MRDRGLSGAPAAVQDKARFNQIAEELTELSTKFGNNVLDATKAYTKLLTTEEEAEGLPESARALMAQQAKAKGHEDATAESGPWLVTLDIPSYLPVQVHCANRTVREEVYRAFVTRASEGERDNTPVITRILQLRKEKAALLGYEHHAAVSMASKARCPRVLVCPRVVCALVGRPFGHTTRVLSNQTRRLRALGGRGAWRVCRWRTSRRRRISWRNCGGRRTSPASASSTRRASTPRRTASRARS